MEVMNSSPENLPNFPAANCSKVAWDNSVEKLDILGGGGEATKSTNDVEKMIPWSPSAKTEEKIILIYIKKQYNIPTTDPPKIYETPVSRYGISNTYLPVFRIRIRKCLGISQIHSHY
jgi:hypothetical protein